MRLVTNRWYPILASKEVPARRPVGARRLGQDLVVWRDAAGTPHAALDRCPHRAAQLSLGRVVEGTVECPFHGWRFAGDGTCTRIPAHPDRPISAANTLPTLSLSEAHGFIWVFSGPDTAPPDLPPFFDFTGYSFAGSAFEAEWPVHYTRSVENQLDFTHLPFVHRNTIGRGLAPDARVETRTEGDRIFFGTEGSGVTIEFLGPALWRLPTGPFVWQFLAFVPVDATRMIYYARAYQKLVRLPGFDWIVGRIGAAFSKVILRQDEAVVKSQPRGETRLGAGEHLVPSDAPIIAYRRWREEKLVKFDPAAGRVGVIPEATSTV